MAQKQGDNYFVTDINYDNETLTLVDVDIAIASQECPRASHNLTLGSLPLAYNSANVNLTFLFNCTTPVVGIHADSVAIISANFVAIGCLRSGDNQSYVFVNKSPEEVAALDKGLDCEDTEVAPVKRTNVTAGNVVEEFAGAMNEGFVLDWEKAKECGECEHSGGRCAVNEKEQLLCYCDDESIHNDGSFCERNKKIGLKVGIGNCFKTLSSTSLHSPLQFCATS
ncbi:uncharacterized protein LOC115741274 [Rhodamnia argentea]|uniref:Uncharacterized protein LOC115741274 n=1 Tax=Rhodamnia argentea TaxID=178133 RepID=A0ABM3HJ02_9MYRT|nr:uncharacterized protein LOC115741274 [Rhodamnia argentea]